MKVMIGDYPDDAGNHVAQVGDPRQYPFGLIYESPPMLTRELAVLDARRWAEANGYEPVFGRLADGPMAGWESN